VAHAEASPHPASQERWLLYELAHLWGEERAHSGDAHELQRARSRAVQRYFSAVYLDDLSVAAEGPLCALDVDGVLETEHLGFPTTSPAGARAVRALVLHGYRPVLATGRSLPEVIERCAPYRLAGGVAEYGSAIYESRSGQATVLVPDEASKALDVVRAFLAAQEGIALDPDYRLTVRAFRGRSGTRTGLSDGEIAAALEAGGAAVRAVPGEQQTDFVATSIDKGAGLSRLSSALGAGAPGGVRPIALAVGDTASDAPMAPLADIAAAPAHGHRSLHAAGFRFSARPYQAGLEDAVERLIGHGPGGCALCWPRSLENDTRRLLPILGAQEQGVRGLVSHALRLAIRVPPRAAR
jgi:hydroxymethylpyrimidine pyrophosphatase-like HAD family hydrolase